MLHVALSCSFTFIFHAYFASIFFSPHDPRVFASLFASLECIFSLLLLLSGIDFRVSLLCCILSDIVILFYTACHRRSVKREAGRERLESNSHGNAVIVINP